MPAGHIELLPHAPQAGGREHTAAASDAAASAASAAAASSRAAAAAAALCAASADSAASRSAHDACPRMHPTVELRFCCRAACLNTITTWVPHARARVASPVKPLRTALLTGSQAHQGLRIHCIRTRTCLTRSRHAAMLRAAAHSLSSALACKQIAMQLGEALSVGQRQHPWGCNGTADSCMQHLFKEATQLLCMHTGTPGRQEWQC